jgi:hypothetical protein
MQIAFFAVAKIPKSERGDAIFAKKTCDLSYSAATARTFRAL